MFKKTKLLVLSVLTVTAMAVTSNNAEAQVTAAATITANGASQAASTAVFNSLASAAFRAQLTSSLISVTSAEAVMQLLNAIDGSNNADLKALAMSAVRSANQVANAAVSQQQSKAAELLGRQAARSMFSSSTARGGNAVDNLVAVSDSSTAQGVAIIREAFEIARSRGLSKATTQVENALIAACQGQGACVFSIGAPNCLRDFDPQTATNLLDIVDEVEAHMTNAQAGQRVYQSMQSDLGQTADEAKTNINTLSSENTCDALSRSMVRDAGLQEAA